MQRKATRPRDVQATSKKGGYNLSPNDGLFDDGFDFVRGDTTVPDRLSRRSADLENKRKG